MRGAVSEAEYKLLRAYFDAHVAADKAITALAFANAMAQANRAKAELALIDKAKA
jgi:hypothetical protein